MRVLGLLVLLLLVGGVIVWMGRAPSQRAVPPAAAEYAPLVPENETPVPPDADLREACLASLRAAIPDTAYAGMLFTRSETWGLVLRADYALPDLVGPNVNRVVCARGKDGKVRVNVAMGQKIPPLPAPP